MTHEEWEEKKMASIESMFHYKNFYGVKWKEKWKRDTGMTPEETDQKYEDMRKEIEDE